MTPPARCGGRPTATATAAAVADVPLVSAVGAAAFASASPAAAAAVAAGLGPRWGAATGRPRVAAPRGWRGGWPATAPPRVASRVRVPPPTAAASPPPPPPSAGSGGAPSAGSPGSDGGGGRQGGGGGGGGGGSPATPGPATAYGALATHPLVVGARSPDSLTRLRAILGLRSLLSPVVDGNDEDGSGGGGGSGDGRADDAGAASSDAEPSPAAVAEAVIKAVFTPLDRETDVNTRCTATAAIGMVPPFPGAYDLLVDLISRDPSEEVRSAAMGALGYLGDARAAPMLRRALLEDTHWSARQSAAVSLGMLRDAAAYELLAEGAATGGDGGGGGMARACIGALGELGDLRAVPAVVAALAGGTDGGGGGGAAADASAFISKQVAAEALGGLPCAEAVAALEAVVDSNEHVNVVWAAELSLKRVRAALDAPPPTDTSPSGG